jgi:hypothetical protein
MFSAVVRAGTPVSSLDDISFLFTVEQHPAMAPDTFFAQTEDGTAYGMDCDSSICGFG